MTTDLSPETAVVHLTTPQIITSESVVGVGVGVGGRGAGAGAGGGAVELGRRLLLAARAGDTQLVLDLMAKGAPFTTDWLGTSPLHLAASNAHVETCGVLLRAGVSRDSRTKVERTPLHLAAYAGHAQVVELLLEHGALVDCRDMLNMTPLHWAAERGHTAVAAALLRHGADARALTKYHKTAAQLAAARQHRALAALIHDALRQREAARSVRAIQPYRQAEETPEPQKPTFTAVHRIQEIKIKPKPVPEKLAKIESKVETAEAPSEATAEGAAEGAVESGAEGGAEGGADGGAGGGAGGAGGALGAAALLRRHGITLLPADDGGTLLSALQSGRTVVLSDAGKLMLKESSEASPPAAAPAPAAAAPGAGAGARGRGVVLTATPVRAPPPGVKVFTLNQRLRPAAAAPAPAAASAPAQPQRITLDSQQVKFVQLASEGRAASPRAVRGRRLAAGARAPVKIIMNKTNFQRLVAGARRDADAPDLSTGEVATVASSKASTASERSLAAQLAAAQRTIATLTEELRVTRARLAQYEPPE